MKNQVTKNIEDPIFSSEQAHLTEVYGKLSARKAAIEKELKTLRKEAAEEKNTVSDDLQYDFIGIEESQETLIEFETMSRTVEQMNISEDALYKRHDDINRLLPHPYFARITVDFQEDDDAGDTAAKNDIAKEDERVADERNDVTGANVTEADSDDVEDFYIGTTAMASEDHTPLIIDWRSPIAEVYYNQEMGHTSYTVDDRTIPVKLKLRRQFDLEEKVLKAYFDTKIALEDPLLIHSLTRKRTDKMQSITETIQKEQNEVIRYPDVPALFVEGIAGSGKTSVLLQRIAYLFYRQRRTLKPNQVCLITLNPVFQQYIDHVLPEMGEMNPVTMTWSDFLYSLSIDSLGEADITEASALRKIDERLPKLVLNEHFLHHIGYKGQRIIDKKQITQILRKYGKTSSPAWLVQNAVEELLELAKTNAKRLQKKEEERTGSDIFDEENTYESKLGGVLDKIRQFAWLDFDAIGHALMGKEKDETLTPAEYTYLRLSLTGESDRNTKYVIIDEAQDYTEAQIMVLRKYFRTAHFMFLGDEYQAIYGGTATFRDIRSLFKEDDVKELRLMTSYRSSPEITKLFLSLLPDEIKVETHSVQREGIEPEIAAFENHDQYVAKLLQVLEDNAHTSGLTAIICNDWTGLNLLTNALKDKTPHIMKKHEALPKSGIVAMELSLAKGLEFDTVILPDVTDRQYPDRDLYRHRLYTAMSRATEKLIILADGQLSSLIQR